MTDLLPASTCRVPRPRPTPGPLDTRFYDLVEARVRRLFTRQPGRSRRCSASTPRTTTSATAAATRSSTRSPPTAPTSRRSRRSTPTGLSRARPVRARPRGPQPPPRAVRGRRVPALGAPGDGGRRDRRRAVPRCSRVAPPRWPSASSGSRTGSRPPRRTSSGSKSRLVGAPVRTWLGWRLVRRTSCPRCSTRSSRRRPTSSRGPSRRGCGARSRRQRGLDDYTAWLREAMPDATDDWPLGGERYDELVRLRAFGDLDADTILAIGDDQLRTSLEARRAAARELDPDADFTTVLDRLKSDHPADVRGGPRRLPRRDAPGPGARHRPRHRDDPAGRARRGHRDAGVPARGDALRGVLRARPVRRRPARPVHRHARRRRRPGRDARALLGVDLATRASTRRTRATTSSSRSPPATRASPGCSPTPPSSSRAGACTASR